MLGAGMQLAQENAALACGDASVAFRGRAHAGKFLQRHEEEKLILGIRQKNEFFGTLSTATRGDGDASFFIDGVPKFAGVKGVSRGDAIHGPAGLTSTLIHFVPLLTTTAPCGQYFFFAFTRKNSAAHTARGRSSSRARPARTSLSSIWRAEPLYLASLEEAADPPFARRVASPFLRPLSLLPSPAQLKHHAPPRFCLSPQRRNRSALRFRAGRKRRGSRQRRPQHRWLAHRLRNQCDQS